MDAAYLWAVWLVVALVAIVLIAVLATLAIRRSRRGSDGRDGETGAPGSVGSTGAAGAAGSAGPTGSTQQWYEHYIGFPLALSTVNPPIPTDLDLVNPWGAAVEADAPGPNDVVWVATHVGKLKQYVYSFIPNPNPVGNQPFPVFPFLTPLQVVDMVDTGDAPRLTGVTTRDYGATGFVIEYAGVTGPALVMTVSEQGKIYGYNPSVTPTGAIMVVDNSASGPNYKGCEILGDRFFVTNFTQGHVEAYDPNWQLVNTFTDPDTDLIIVDGFTTYNVRAFDDRLFVTFVFRSGGEDADVGIGNGLIDIFLPDGTFVQRYTALSNLNVPWGMTRIPAAQTLSGQDELLVSNFGDGRLLRYAFSGAAFFGFISDLFVNPIVNVGLNDCIRLPKASATGLAQLLVTSGPVNRQEGLLLAELQLPNRLP